MLLNTFYCWSPKVKYTIVHLYYKENDKIDKNIIGGKANRWDKSFNVLVRILEEFSQEIEVHPRNK